MGNKVMLALTAVAVVGAAIAAVFFFDLRLPASAADQQRAGALFDQSQTALEGGDQDAALQALNDSISLDPQNHALRSRASLLVARGEYDPALRDLDRLMRRGGGLAENYSLRCWLRARAGQLDGARNDCDRALEINPELASAFGNRGVVGIKQNRNREAWDDFNTALRVGGSDGWVAWRLFGRGLAAWNRGEEAQGRQDVEQALRINPAATAQFADLGLGGEMVLALDDAMYAAALSPRALLELRNYLYMYPNGAHAAEAQALVDEIYASIAADQAAGRQTLPGFSLAQARGPAGPEDDSFGAIAISRTGWRVAFATDYATPGDAEQAGRNACQSGGSGSCEAFAFRNVCASLALSAGDRVRGMAWAHAEDDAVYTAVAHCRSRGGRACVPVHTQCTPTQADRSMTPGAQ